MEYMDVKREKMFTKGEQTDASYAVIYKWIIKL